jgi:hypothetical protein
MTLLLTLAGNVYNVRQPRSSGGDDSDSSTSSSSGEEGGYAYQDNTAAAAAKNAAAAAAAAAGEVAACSNAAHVYNARGRHFLQTICRLHRVAPLHKICHHYFADCLLLPLLLRRLLRAPCTQAT